MATTGAKLLVECLLKAGVERIYGIIGTSNVAFVDAIYDAKEQIRYISCRHEQVAASMADTEGRLTGMPGVVMLHSGPGALNAAISLGNAAKDCSPAIAITGAVKRKLKNIDGMLHTDHLSVFAPICRAVYRVDDTVKIPEIFKNAWETATGLPPGPVLIEVPEDVWTEQVEEPPEVEAPVMKDRPTLSYKEIEEVVEALNSAVIVPGTETVNVREATVDKSLSSSIATTRNVCCASDSAPEVTVVSVVQISGGSWSKE